VANIYPDETGQPHMPEGQPGSTGGDPLKEQAQAAREKLGEAGQAVRGEAAHFAEATRDKVIEQVESRKETVTNALSAFAEAIYKAGEELSSADQSMAARLVSQAADGLQSLSRTVAEKRPEDMLHAVRDFGRANPTAFLAGAVLAGVALGRFARSSARHDQPTAETFAASPGPDQLEGAGIVDPYVAAPGPDDAAPAQPRTEF
jgi:hypothetical protein